MNNEIITLPLGFRFVVGNDVVEVQKAGMSCERCLFYDNACSLPFRNIKCCSSLRSDEVNVSFVKVGEVKS